VSPNVGEVWVAHSGGQKAHYLTIELVPVLMPSSGITVPHWQCLCLDNGSFGLTSLDMKDSAVTWRRIA
jgi:hypothetical protein